MCLLVEVGVCWGYCVPPHLMHRLVPFVFPVVRHRAVLRYSWGGSSGQRFARIGRHHGRRASARPAPRGAERTGRHAKPPRGHALLHEPEELPGERRRGGGILRPRRHHPHGLRSDDSGNRRSVREWLGDVTGRRERRWHRGCCGLTRRGRGEPSAWAANRGRTHRGGLPLTQPPPPKETPVALLHRTHPTME